MSLHPVTSRVEVVPRTRLVLITLDGGPGGSLLIDAHEARRLAGDLQRAARMALDGRGRRGGAARGSAKPSARRSRPTLPAGSRG